MRSLAGSKQMKSSSSAVSEGGRVMTPVCDGRVREEFGLKVRPREPPPLLIRICLPCLAKVSWNCIAISILLWGERELRNRLNWESGD